ncbi:MAG: thiosulfate oxidation carrier complex protein SoxZ, partial [Betaproteobacteria bacterium]|nr:thiosulfate oxidation carrier complex protein SoxZ [Betaproteobacteria bacterium]
MGEPIRIRATVAGGLVEVRIVMPHAMETGRRTDAKGEVIPAHFIRNVSVEHNGK